MDKLFIERLKQQKLQARESYFAVKMPPRNNVLMTLSDMGPANKMQDNGEMSYRLRAVFTPQADEAVTFKDIPQVWGFTDQTYTETTFGTGEQFIELLFKTIRENGWDHEPSIADLVGATFLVDLKKNNDFDTIYPLQIVAFAEQSEEDVTHE